MQLLTVYGAFNSYNGRILRVSNDACSDCGRGTRDDAEHVIIMIIIIIIIIIIVIIVIIIVVCPTYAAEREELVAALGRPLDPDSLMRD